MTKETKWSILTKAIRKNTRIDWWAIDGRRGRVTSSEDNHSTNFTFMFYRDTNYPEGTMEGMTGSNIPAVFGDLIAKAWRGEEGLRLWVEGEIPLRQRTAADLPLGTCFLGMDGYDYFLYKSEDGKKIARLRHSEFSKYAEHVEVQNTYGVGTFRHEGQEEE